MANFPADKASNANSEGDVPSESSPDSAERKRLAARRRFLVGGAAAVPLILTFGHREAHAAGMSVCMSQVGFPGEGGGTPTFVCRLFPNPQG